MKTLILFSLFYLFFTSALYATGEGKDAAHLSAGVDPSEQTTSRAGDVQERFGLQECADKKFGISFLCNPAWLMQKGREAILVVISRDPDVSLIIARIPSRFTYLEQISTDDLLNLKQYEPGFEKEHVKFNGIDALMVKAISSGISEKRILDYFLIKDNTLYTILFSVGPREKWDEYKFLIKRIAESIRFSNHSAVQENSYRG